MQVVYNFAIHLDMYIIPRNPRTQKSRLPAEDNFFNDFWKQFSVIDFIDATKVAFIEVTH